jgi:hypothetical protein
MKALTLSATTLLACALACALVTAARAEAKTIATIVTCQQDDGDQWVEVGLVRAADQGLEALVVLHDADDGSSRLRARYDVMSFSRGSKVSYQTSNQTFSLVIENASGRSVGQLDVLLGDGQKLSKTGLFCYPDSDITID